MLLLLPPSETKRDGGLDATALEWGSLGFPSLTRERVTVAAALRRVSRSVSGSMAALSLGPTQRFEIDRNRVVHTSFVMPALERYTGVLYDALDVATLSPQARVFAGDHLVIHSALFGLLEGDDRIPAYRLSHNSRLPGLSLRTHWRDPVTSALGAVDRLILDLRSDSYTALGPLPSLSAAGRPGAVSSVRATAVIRVVSEGEGGRRIALSHFNKAGKGEFARAVVEAGIVHDTVESLVLWASANGIRLEPTASGLDLVV